MWWVHAAYGVVLPMRPAGDGGINVLLFVVWESGWMWSHVERVLMLSRRLLGCGINDVRW